MTPRDKRITPRELQVLRWIGPRRGVSVREVADHFGETEGLARTTLLTVMQRLHAQGYLRRREVDGIHRYSTTRTAEALQDEAVDAFLTDMLEGSAAGFVAYLTRHRGQLGADEIEELRKLVDELEDDE